MASLVRDTGDLSTGPSLDSHLTSSPAEDLHTSQACSIRASKAKKQSRRLGSWNVRSLLYSEGPVKTARQGRDTVQAEDRRINQVVQELSRYRVKGSVACYMYLL